MTGLQTVMDAAGSERPVLFGTLGGAAMAGVFAASYPERTRALVVYGSFAKLGPTTGLLARLSDSREVALDRIEGEWGNASVGIASWAPSLIADEQQADAYLRLLRSSLSP
jgi:pimeloyl-ACP methyl ester carboxylesterase